MIVGVAIKNDNITISLPRPNRHCHCFQYMWTHFGEEAAKKLAIGMQGKNQGFVTDKGVYLDRLQAMRHAKRCGQKLVEHEDVKHQWNHPLFSEDLW